MKPLPSRFISRNAGHVDRAAKRQALPEALEYLWQGYPIDQPQGNAR
jgi:hypothetical protein